ncbi:cellulose synthase complex periplasmic endoglucanase BcsZ [Bordetella genomosp. 13]|uniref:cellulose synthase complex periplasmic endoglucanase BcsZ n=1 Tax=Bordetella genomosp. 13 TaxID=463040 RepID=UPI0021B5578B|nr:cellulose synthase complex periplasmic endoglucanase BcsZ [Bordetella genomosp. 13]
MRVAPLFRLPRLPGRAAAMLCGVAAALLMALPMPAARAAGAAAPGTATCGPQSWPKWDGYLTHFVQPDGRVLDASTPQRHSSSEGQSYGMFFALVAGDRKTFDQLWQWTVDNLAGGDISKNLPAWFWGLRQDGTWGVLDTNAASDADVWFVYALLEAARLWNRPRYERDARALLALIEAREIAQVPGLGPMLLPGPIGFVQPGLQWRFNPSYLPVPVLRRLAEASPQGPWAAIADNTLRMVRQTSPHGFAPDWTAYRAEGDGGAFVADPVKGPVGSYDAIRVYLWAGMTPSTDPLAAPMLEAVQGLAQATAKAGMPPEIVQTDAGSATGTGPFGFSAALLPYLQATGQAELLRAQLHRVQADWDASVASAQPGQRQPPYYDYMLSLFGTAWLEQRYKFGASGRVRLPKEKTCP